MPVLGLLCEAKKLTIGGPNKAGYLIFFNESANGRGKRVNTAFWGRRLILNQEKARCHNTRCFSTQPVVSQTNGNVSTKNGFFNFSRRKIAFGTNEDNGRRIIKI